ncbi:tail fiber protein [Mannheimia pernigra]|uniref:tail fiber protein n=1 Tax=Mannheimia pernigra TaxID=111844 RepID=UPI00159F57D1|nr:tail fiber protein [Mannheimia pernigra]QLB43527.1 tail fiber protein [Mannheimia pernigra]
MAGVKEIPQWENHVYRIEENDPVHGGEDGITNKPIKHLANRTLYLRRLMTEAGQRINPKKITAESRNSNDLTGHTHEIDQASTTVKGIVQLGNEINSNAEDKAATLKAVKTAYDKGVEAENKADEALGVANAKQSPATSLSGYGIADFVVQSATGDLNTYRTDGIYSFNSRSTTTNAPPNKTGHLIVIAGGPGNERWCRQIFRTHYTGEHYERWQTSGSDDNWSDWQRTDITLTLNNTLTSTATDQALTAAQGKVLKDLIDAVQGIANGNAGAGHLHVIADITGLQNALNGKANSSHNHGISEITGLQNALNNKANDRHNHGISDITGLQNALNNKANDRHNHGISEITGLQNALNNKANDRHNHGISDITGLQNALNNKANDRHNHGISDITGLQNALNNKANDRHNHGISDITDLQAALNGKADNATTLAGYGITDGVRQDEFVYQKIGNFEISKYPDGRMIQTYVYEQYDIIPERSRLQNFRWAIAFAERPLVMAQVTTSMNEAHDAGVNITSGSNNTQVYYHLYEHSNPNQAQCRIQFLGVGKWK